MDWKLWMIAGLTLAVILLIVFRRPPPIKDKTKQAYQDTVAALMARNAIKEATIDAVIERSNVRHQVDSLKLEAMAKENKAIKAKAAKAVAAIPKEARETYPQIDSALAAKDAVIAAAETRADSIQASLDFQLRTVDKLTILIKDDRMNDEQLQIACAKRNADLEKIVEKTFKQKTFWQKLGSTAVVIVIVETAILILQ